MLKRLGSDGRRWECSLLVHRTLVAATVLFVSANVSHAGLILMPAGSDVWMKWESNVAQVGGDDVAGSNLPGLAPPNGIPLNTITDAQGRFSTGFAEVLPTSVRTFIRANTATSMTVSMNDTYTVHGTSVGSFPITFAVNYAGEFRSVVSGPFDILTPTLLVEIGTFNPDPNVVLEQFRVTPFNDPLNVARLTPGTTFAGAGNPIIVPFDITATYTRMVQVGDVFDLGIGFTSTISPGTVDALNTGTIAINGLPDGTFVTSRLGGQFGNPGPNEPVPEPASLTLLLSSAACCGGFCWRRRRRNCSEPPGFLSAALATAK